MSEEIPGGEHFWEYKVEEKHSKAFENAHSKNQGNGESSEQTDKDILSEAGIEDIKPDSVIDEFSVEGGEEAGGSYGDIRRQQDLQQQTTERFGSAVDGSKERQQLSENNQYQDLDTVLGISGNK
jgi:hypothetical protein